MSWRKSWVRSPVTSGEPFAPAFAQAPSVDCSRSRAPARALSTRQLEDEPWIDARARRALVVDSGIGGQVRVTTLDEADFLPAAREAAPYLFVLDGERLNEERARLSDVGTDLARAAMDFRATNSARPVALVISDREELDEVLSLRADGRRVFRADEPLQGELAFVFPGSGAHFSGMGRALLRDFPFGLKHAALERLFDKDFCFQKNAHQMAQDHVRLILSQVTLGTLASDAVRAFGVEPNAVIGYSLGETAGLFALGAWTEREKMMERVRSSPLFTEDLAGPCTAAQKTFGSDVVDWCLGVVGATKEEVDAALGPRAYRLIVNTDDECVIGGERADVERVVRALDSDVLSTRGRDHRALRGRACRRGTVPRASPSRDLPARRRALLQRRFWWRL